MDKVLKQVEIFARNAHGSQRRKFVDELYIEHPIRVMQMCATVTQKLPILAAALLHDVVEDTAVTKEEIKEFLTKVMSEADAEKTVKLVMELTDVYTHEAFPQWNRRVRKDKENERLQTTSPESRTIKYADIIDNAAGISGNDFAPRLLQEMRRNLKTIPGGDESLYRKAVDTVETELKKLGL